VPTSRDVEQQHSGGEKGVTWKHEEPGKLGSGGLLFRDKRLADATRQSPDGMAENRSFSAPYDQDPMFEIYRGARFAFCPCFSET
jgi:hypothetical protein